MSDCIVCVLRVPLHVHARHRFRTDLNLFKITKDVSEVPKLLQCYPTGLVGAIQPTVAFSPRNHQQFWLLHQSPLALTLATAPLTVMRRELQGMCLERIGGVQQQQALGVGGMA